MVQFFVFGSAILPGEQEQSVDQLPSTTQARRSFRACLIEDYDGKVWPDSQAGAGDGMGTNSQCLFSIVPKKWNSGTSSVKY